MESRTDSGFPFFYINNWENEISPDLNICKFLDCIILYDKNFLSHIA